MDGEVGMWGNGYGGVEGEGEAWIAVAMARWRNLSTREDQPTKTLVVGRASDVMNGCVKAVTEFPHGAGGGASFDVTRRVRRPQTATRYVRVDQQSCLRCTGRAICPVLFSLKRLSLVPRCSTDLCPREHQQALSPDSSDHRPVAFDISQEANYQAECVPCSA